MKNFFQTLIAGGILCFRDQSGQDNNFGIDIQSGQLNLGFQMPLQGSHLIENIDHLASGIRFAKSIVLSKPAMG